MDNSQLANQPKNPIAKDTMQTKQMRHLYRLCSLCCFLPRTSIRDSHFWGRHQLVHKLWKIMENEVQIPMLFMFFTYVFSLWITVFLALFFQVPGCLMSRSHNYTVLYMMNTTSQSIWIDDNWKTVKQTKQLDTKGFPYCWEVIGKPLAPSNTWESEIKSIQSIQLF